jgi:hypothetical protein
MQGYTCTVGGNSPFEFLSQRACSVGVEGLCTGVLGTLPFDRESCLSGSDQAVHGALPGYSLPAAVLFVLSRPSSITRHLAGCVLFC